MKTLDHQTCYQAISRRDARFDGRFYTAVTTTGIFCRPSCPARTPKSSNVRFYAHAATASEAGYRPCRRCRPELAPGHPEWNRRADLTGRALKLIEAGTVDSVGVAGLAAQLGVSERHLRRELQTTVGTGPLQLARTRRLWLARLLLDQTALPITDVAFASGFSSIRQFNDSIRQAFDAPPSALRRRVGTESTGSTVALHLPSRGALRWPSLHAFFAHRTIPGLESTTDQTFRRNVTGGWIELGGPTGEDKARPDVLSLTCSLDRLSDLAELLPLVRTVADLDADLEPIEAHLGHDPLLKARLVSTPLGRLPGAFDPFEVAVRAVVGQQVSVAAARTLLGRLIRIANGDGSAPRSADKTVEIDRFPSADRLATCSLDALGMPQRRKDTIQGVARAVAEGSVVLGRHTDPAETTAALLALPGIGPWTAGYIAMRVSGDPNGWPEADLALRRSADLPEAELEARSAAWRPWRAYAALLLWNSDPTQKTKNPRKIR